MGTLRGAKRDLWEGGHRVPFLARLPGKICRRSNARGIPFWSLRLIAVFDDWRKQRRLWQELRSAQSFSVLTVSEGVSACGL
jgi:hypothetical protein